MISFDDCVLIGRITRKWGFNNEVLILPGNNTSGKFKLTGSVFIDIDKQLIPFNVTAERKHGNNGRIVRFSDLSVVLLERIIGCCVWVNHAGEGSRFFSLHTGSDRLHGYVVKDVNLGELGIAVRLLDREMQPLLLVDNEHREILIPFIPQIIKKTDHKNRQIIVETPEGLTTL